MLEKFLNVVEMFLIIVAVVIMVLGIWGQITLGTQEHGQDRFRCVSSQDGASRNERLYVYEDTQTGKLYLYTAGFHRAGLCELNTDN